MSISPNEYATRAALAVRRPEMAMLPYYKPFYGVRIFIFAA